jgi:hypothetical protein
MGWIYGPKGRFLIKSFFYTLTVIEKTEVKNSVTLSISSFTKLLIEYLMLNFISYMDANRFTYIMSQNSFIKTSLILYYYFHCKTKVCVVRSF